MDYDKIVLYIGNILMKLNIFKKDLPETVIETNVQEADITIVLTCKKGIHIYPRYYKYKTGFANTTICEDCLSIGLYEDQHPSNVCINCGGNIIEYKPGKFDYSVNRWFVRNSQ